MNGTEHRPNIDYGEGYEVPAAYLRLADTRISGDPQADFPIWEHEFFKIGRDPTNNTFSIQNDGENLVSRNHCEIYVIVYEQSINHVYIRDRKSFNGTYVNGQLIGVGPQISSGYLLQDGDIIEIRPYWKFLFCQTRNPLSNQLTAVQARESRVFQDKYLLSQRCLGSGAEASVYLATDATTNKQLVCKVVNLGKQGWTSTQRQFGRKLQEVDTLRQLRHPNVLSYIDAIVSPNSLYIFMELASGGDLVSFLNRHNAVSELDACILLRQVVRGLSYLHRKGIVHRDLKPENILLAYSPRIAYHRVMISDFGACAVPRRSRMMTDVGTNEYKAPEMQTNFRSQTTAVDIWSLGLVSLRVLTYVFDDMRQLSLLSQTSLEETIGMMMSQVSPKLSSNSRNFVSGCLQVVPANRTTATEAEYHDWFCTSPKHTKLFQLLDERALPDWYSHEELKPMPLELSNLDLHESCVGDNNSVRAGQPECEEMSEHFSNARTGIFRAEVCTASPPSPPQCVYHMGQTATFDDEPKGAEESSGALSSKNVQINERLTVKNSPRIVKIHKSALTPRPGLDRYLTPAVDNTKREAVLAELKRTNAKFINDAYRLVPRKQTDDS